MAKALDIRSRQAAKHGHLRPEAVFLTVTPPKSARRSRRNPLVVPGSILAIHGLWRSLVSALDWGSRGREFKSPQPD